MMTDIKAIQNIGRILRPLKGKKLAIVAIPGFDLFADAGARFRKLLEKLQTIYGWPGYDWTNDWMDPNVDEEDVDELSIEKASKREKNPLDDVLDGLAFEFWRSRMKNKNALQKIKALRKGIRV
jgi:hypothetical protein